MNRNRSFQRKVAYGIAIAALLFPLFYLGQPAGQNSQGGKLAQMRVQHNLSQGNLGEIDPASETMKLATLGMRPFATVVLWEKANEYKKKEDWDNLAATLNQITKLDPNILSVWEFQAHNLSYNVSVEFDDYRHRYQWVKKGIDFLIRGSHYNRDEPKLLWNIGWFIGHKMGRSDEKVQFRRLFRADEDFHRDLQDNGEIKVDEADAQGPDGRPDSWLVSRLWYVRAEDALTLGKQLRGKSPLLFYADSPMSRINFASSIEDEGILDEKAQIAWERAGDEWRRYGDRSVIHSTGHVIRLNEIAKLYEERDDLRGKLNELVPGGREKVLAAKREKLTDEEREALETPIEKRTPPQHMQFEIASSKLVIEPLDLAEEAPAEVKGKARRLAERLTELEQRYLRHTEAYRNQVNYDYWKNRCAMEQTETAVTARRHLFEAERAMEAADPESARKSFESAWDCWADLLDQFPSMLDTITIQELGESMARYNQVLGQLDLKMPENFRLQMIWERHLKSKGQTTTMPAGKPDGSLSPPTPPAPPPLPGSKTLPQKPSAEKPATEQPATEKPAAEKPAAEKPEAEKPADAKPATEKPASDKPVDEKPAAEKPSAEKPADPKPGEEKPAAEKPADAKSSDSKPADEKPSDEQPK